MKNLLAVFSIVFIISVAHAQSTIHLTISNQTDSLLTVDTHPVNTTVDPIITSIRPYTQQSTSITEYGIGANWCQFLIKPAWITLSIQGPNLTVSYCNYPYHCQISHYINQYLVIIEKQYLLTDP